MKKIEDYLHLYLGCEVETPDGVGWLASVSRDRRKMDGLMLSTTVKVDFKTIRLTANSVDGYDKKRNHGYYLIRPEGYVGIKAPAGTPPDFVLPGGIKPILRELSSMTEQEAIELAKLSEWEPHFRDVKVNTNGFFDKIVTWQGMAESRESFNATGELFYCAEQFQWLLSKGFDLFNLIPEGLAIDKTKLNSEPK